MDIGNTETDADRLQRLLREAPKTPLAGWCVGVVDLQHEKPFSLERDVDAPVGVTVKNGCFMDSSHGLYLFPSA